LLPSAIRTIEVATRPKASHASRAIALLEERLVLGASRLHIGRQRGGYCDESYDDKSHTNPSLGCAQMYRGDKVGARDRLNPTRQAVSRPTPPGTPPWPRLDGSRRKPGSARGSARWRPTASRERHYKRTGIPDFFNASPTERLRLLQVRSNAGSDAHRKAPVCR